MLQYLAELPDVGRIMARKTKVLVIEDDYGIADNLEALLQVKGYQVFLATDGQSGVEVARQQLPDVILLDIMLPRLNGFDVCRILKSEEKTKDIKIIAITGLGQMRDVENAFAAGAAEYIIKPFNSERLLAKIESVLARS